VRSLNPAHDSKDQDGFKDSAIQGFKDPGFEDPGFKDQGFAISD